MLEALQYLGCIACRAGYEAGATEKEKDIYIVPLPHGDPVGLLGRFIPRVRNALRYQYPGLCGELRFCTRGDRLLFLADEVNEPDLEATRAGYLSTRGMDLWVADLRQKRVWCIQPSFSSTLRREEYSWYYDWAGRADQYVLAKRGQHLLLIEPSNNTTRYWLLYENIGNFWVSTDRVRVYCEGAGEHLLVLECTPKPVARSLPPLPRSNRIYTLFPTYKGVIVLTYRITGHEPKEEVPVTSAKTVWEWEEAAKSFRKIGSIPEGVEVSGFSESAGVLFIWKPFTKYNREHEDPAVEVGAWSRRDNKIRWLSVRLGDRLAAPTSLVILSDPRKRFALLLLGNPYSDWMEVGVLEPDPLRVAWLRRLWWSSHLAWTPYRCV